MRNFAPLIAVFCKYPYNTSDHNSSDGNVREKIERRYGIQRPVAKFIIAKHKKVEKKLCNTNCNLHECRYSPKGLSSTNENM